KILRLNSWEVSKKENFLSIFFQEIYKIAEKDGTFNNTTDRKYQILALLKSINLKGNISGVDLTISHDKYKSMYSPLIDVSMKERINGILGKDNTRDKKFLVFIDDLDRCGVETIINILETIKLLFDSTNCIFFLGCDIEHLKNAIVDKYKDFIKFKASLEDKEEKEVLREFTNEYLEKLIQIPFYLPNLEAENIKLYIDSILKNNNIGHELNSINVDNNLSQVDVDANQLIESIISNFINSTSLISNIFYQSRLNPRKIKRILNQSILQSIFMEFNSVNNNIDIPFLILLVTIREIDNKYFNENFWNESVAINTINSWSNQFGLYKINAKEVEVRQDTIEEDTNEHSNKALEVKVPPKIKVIVNLFFTEYFNNESDKDKFIIEVKSKMKGYINTSNITTINEVLPAYFEIKSGTGTGKKVKYFMSKIESDSFGVELVDWFFKFWFKPESLEVGVSENLMIYKKTPDKTIEKEYLFSFVYEERRNITQFKYNHKYLKSVVRDDNKIRSITKESITSIMEEISEVIAEVLDSDEICTTIEGNNI
ncbi:MAG: P-loop NTPase fold protein, partial [Clostridium sp.]